MKRPFDEIANLERVSEGSTEGLDNTFPPFYLFWNPTMTPLD
jgi:hypothetical protein